MKWWKTIQYVIKTNYWFYSAILYIYIYIYIVVGVCVHLQLEIVAKKKCGRSYRHLGLIKYYFRNLLKYIMQFEFRLIILKFELNFDV